MRKGKEKVSISTLTLIDLVGKGVEIHTNKVHSSSEPFDHMHKSGVMTRNRQAIVTFKCVVENDDNVETSFVNISSVYGIECVDKIAIVSCGVELSKTHVGVVSDKWSSMRSKEEILVDL